VNATASAAASATVPVHVDVTPRAARHVRSLTVRAGRDPDEPAGSRYGLRVRLAPDGRHRYLLSLVRGAGADELALPRNGFDVLVARAEAESLDGLRIDYVESEAGSGFLVDRPSVPRPPVPRPPVPRPPVPRPGGPALPSPLPASTSPELASRVEAALDDVRPVLVSDGGDVELVGVADGVAYVRLQGACNGCGAALATLTHLVEATVASAVPEVPRTVLVA
jgi:iron-sulfur cluster assembly protein